MPGTKPFAAKCEKSRPPRTFSNGESKKYRHAPFSPNIYFLANKMTTKTFKSSTTYVCVCVCVCVCYLPLYYMYYTSCKCYYTVYYIILYNSYRYHYTSITTIILCSRYIYFLHLELFFNYFFSFFVQLSFLIKTEFSKKSCHTRQSSAKGY